VLVGRSARCARIGRILATARGGAGGALLLVGGPGMGKSVLLQVARRRADGMTVLEAQGVQAESELAYAGLSQLLRPVLGDLERLVVPRQAEALRAALGLEPRPVVDRFAVYVATMTLLALAAEERPVLAIVDDAHWLDTASAEALAFVARRLRGDAVALLFASREAGASPLDAAPLDRITLPPLEGEEAAMLLQGLGAGPVDRSVAKRLCEATAGNPLGLSELARLLTREQFEGRHPLPEPLPVGPDIERAFGSRIASLGEGAQRALTVVAADESGTVETLARALRLRGSGMTALRSAESAGVLVIGDGRVRFTHPLLRSAAYHRASPPKRRDAHAALAAALEGVPSGGSQRAWHLAAALLEPDETVARKLAAVAVDARERAAPAAAGRTFEAAARLSPAGTQRARRLLEAARAYHLAGATERALPLLEQALDLNDDPLLRADIQLTRAHVEAPYRSPVETRALLIAEAERVAAHERARATVLLAGAAMVSAVLGRPREMQQLAERAQAMSVGCEGAPRLLATVVDGLARILRGDAAAGYPLLARARPLLEGPDPSILGLAATDVLYGELWVGNYEEGRRLAANLVARVREKGALTALPYALFGLAYADFMLGHWPAAYATANESEALATEIGQPTFSPMGRLVMAVIAGAQGRLAEAREHLARTSATVERGVESMVTMAGWARGHVELSAGNYDQVMATLEPTGRFTLECGLEEPGVAPWAQDLAEAYLRVGRVRDGEEILEILERQAERTGRVLAHAAAARCRGLLAGEAEFEAHFRRALSWHERVPCPFERARTELCFGERLRRARRRSEAREPLRAALARFESLEATPWIDRTTAELRATGERARRRRPETADRLTPQELQVAQLITEGATNREAAAALFVTPKTIETHLNHVYRKLGVRSRVELVQKLRLTPV
jgi:DNA-binding CsgD family transcriptional regulator